MEEAKRLFLEGKPDMVESDVEVEGLDEFDFDNDMYEL